MSLADFLDPCPTCGGKGRGEFHDDGVGHVMARGCPDCVGGLVVSEDDIAAVTAAIAQVQRSQTYFDRDEWARAAVTTLIQEWRKRRNA